MELSMLEILDECTTMSHIDHLHTTTDTEDRFASTDRIPHEFIDPVIDLWIDLGSLIAEWTLIELRSDIITPTKYKSITVLEIPLTRLCTRKYDRDMCPCLLESHDILESDLS
jgi:hypothetical protein